MADIDRDGSGVARVRSAGSGPGVAAKTDLQTGLKTASFTEKFAP